MYGTKNQHYSYALFGIMEFQTIENNVLSPKGRRSFFSKKCSNRPFLAREHVQKVYHTDCEIIRFEVERKVFFHCAQ
jgi:hypothetical protein